MEKKIILAAAILAAFFFLGLLALALNRFGVDFGLTKISRYFQEQGIEIKPRVEKETIQEAESNLEKTADAQENTESKAKANDNKKKTEVKLCPVTQILPARDNILINEVAWMGTTQSYADEWIELKNVSDQTVNIEGWQLQNKKQKMKAVFSENAIIEPSGFYIMERTNDDTIPNVTADFIYTGNIGNKNEALYLFDNDCRLKDIVLATPDWPAGDKVTKRTMERTKNLLWQTSSDTEGTPKKENSQGLKK